jgi:hypothetical protein
MLDLLRINGASYSGKLGAIEESDAGSAANVMPLSPGTRCVPPTDLPPPTQRASGKQQKVKMTQDDVNSRRMAATIGNQTLT